VRYLLIASSARCSPWGMKLVDVVETVDARGTVCPIPIIRTAARIEGIAVGAVLEVLATDEALVDDLPAWSRATGHEFLGFQNAPPLYRGYVRRSH
jgi:tRNA 2-thiouridine synthesizing protein A